MNAVLGSAGVAFALAASVIGAGLLVVGTVRRRPVLVGYGYRCVPLVAIGAVVAVLAMQRALITHDFSLKYVAENSDRGTPGLFLVTGMWAALEGSILLWGLVLSGYLVLMRRHLRRQHDSLVAWATAVGLAVAVFFFALMAGPANPFRTLAETPRDGQGANPLLQNHPLMAFHPPILYLGYVGFTVPFAFAIAALITGRVGEGWMLTTRRWTLAAWGCLSLGIVLGAWWSYEVLGWGGYWSWDPVENASFLPWLTGTAYIHSVLVQERRGMLRVWNLSLLCSTFALTILGTFLTRSGVIQSVHAFSESTIGPWLLTFFAVIVAVSVGLIGWRGDRLRAPGMVDSPISREGSFLANNVLFAAFAFVVLLGTVFPLVVEALNNDQLSVGAPYFDKMSMPIGFALLFLMAVAPVLPWRKASGELLRNRLQWPAAFAVVVLVLCVAFGRRGLAPLLTFFLGAFAAGAAARQLILASRASSRRGESWLRGLVGRANGGMVVHLGVVLIAVAIAASRSYATTRTLTLSPGQSERVGSHTVTYLGLRSDEPSPGRVRDVARVRLDGGKVYAPALTRFVNRREAIPTPSVRTGFTHDVYFSLANAPGASGTAVIEVTLQPMILWLWVGGGLMGLGTVLSIVPGRRRLPTAPTSHELVVNGPGPGPSPESDPECDVGAGPGPGDVRTPQEVRV